MIDGPPWANSREEPVRYRDSFTAAKLLDRLHPVSGGLLFQAFLAGILRRAVDVACDDEVFAYQYVFVVSER